MIILGLDGKEHKWNPSRKQSAVGDKNRSKLHIKARALLKDLFPFDRVLEELTLPGTKTSSRRTLLYADFYIPNRSLIVEVHGEQHFKFNSFFYKDKMAFFKAKARDSDKRDWCDINGITLIEFNHSEDIDDWRRKIE